MVLGEVESSRSQWENLSAPCCPLYFHTCAFSDFCVAICLDKWFICSLLCVVCLLRNWYLGERELNLGYMIVAFLLYGMASGSIWNLRKMSPWSNAVFKWADIILAQNPLLLWRAEWLAPDLDLSLPFMAGINDCFGGWVVKALERFSVPATCI